MCVRVNIVLPLVRVKGLFRVCLGLSFVYGLFRVLLVLVYEASLGLLRVCLGVYIGYV